MLSGGLPENLGGREWGEVEGVGWLSVPWGAGGEKKKKKEGVGGSSTRPTHSVQSSPIKRAQRWGGGLTWITKAV